MSTTIKPRAAFDGTSELVIAGRRLSPTTVFDTYWRFAAERQRVYERKLAGQVGPWTADPILARYRFTNCYRASDRVSQHLITQVIYRGPSEWSEVFFRVMLFKLFNRISTWRLLTAVLGEISWANYSWQAYDAVLSGAFSEGQRLYSPAYVIPQPPLGELRKHRNHLRLLELMMATDAPAKIASATTMAAAFEVLKGYPGLGDFLAFQFLIDLNYTSVLSFSEMDFVVAGPGARDGIRKCFGLGAQGVEAEVIRYMADMQEVQFERLGLEFSGLFGRRLQLIDCQNLFCEVDKYSRVAHPHVQGVSGRTRIKQGYRADSAPLTAWFPPKWEINSEELPPAECLEQRR
ncbi:nucleotide kinase domain-containing protein [Nonomuraea sp. NEAU-A123]|uniref:nucleotide kinase domain-containing protein n=1 Tax=Nonomuraea sp. NEAU-A123 TaxID=2839649 RepID=UPI001BE4825A|nr:nucleotide kinase domain-containing protein [Nonomuraea sp. NEAU-A123]MBT2234414.1 hypothetical protein [Nonomuraea sp. NEAU-A123]